MTEKVTPIGLTKDSGFQIGVRRTVEASHARVWELVFSTEGMNIWLGPSADLQLETGQTYCFANGTTGEVRVYKPGSHARITWHPPGYPRPSTIQVRVIDKGQKSVIAFHQEHLPDKTARESRRDHFINALNELEYKLSD